MTTLKEMIIATLQDIGDKTTLKDLTNKLIKKFPEKLASKIESKGDKKSAKQQIYAEIGSATLTHDEFFRDKSTKPLSIGLVETYKNDESLKDDDFEDFEASIGIVYILGTNTFTKNNLEFVKIGITTNLEKRLQQLYTTNTPFKFKVLREYKTVDYNFLEKAMHALLNKYRPNPVREFFTDDCLKHADEIFKLHKKNIPKLIFI